MSWNQSPNPLHNSDDAEGKYAQTGGSVPNVWLFPQKMKTDVSGMELIWAVRRTSIWESPS